MKYTLPWPPSVNQCYRTFRNRTIMSSVGRQYRTNAVASIVTAGVTTVSDTVTVIIRAHQPDRRKRDIDNLLKAPLDALTHAGVWADDSQIVDLRIVKEPPCSEPRLEIEIERA